MRTAVLVCKILVVNLSSDEKPNSRPAPPRLVRAERGGQKRGPKEGKSRYSCCVIWVRNRLRNLSEGVSRAIFNADSEYAIGFLWLSLYFVVSGWVSYHCVVPSQVSLESRDTWLGTTQ